MSANVWSVTKDLIPLDLPPQRVVVSWYNLTTILLPVLLCYYVMAVLVQLPSTKLYRQALFPAVVWLTVIAGITLDFSWGRPELVHCNQTLFSMFTIALRAATWTLADELYVRYSDTGNRYIKVNESKSEPSSLRLDDIRMAMWNACDLCFNLRGLGWNWSKGMHIPQPMFKIESRLIFAVLSLIRFILYTAALSAIGLFVEALTPDGSDGSTIFDPSLPPILRYLRSSTITVLNGVESWIVVELIYQFLAFTFTILFQQRPSQWPPSFDQPWFATSLGMFWGRCWHQIFREWPLEPFLGSYSPIGAFLLSGIFHELGLRGMDRGGDILCVVGYFIMQGVGVALERLFKRLTGRRVGGLVGLLWVWIWQIIWANFLRMIIANSIRWVWKTRTGTVI
ncbi:hypothetical protein V8B97DRAFT_2021521 [Scleroderma yunnanense]